MERLLGSSSGLIVGIAAAVGYAFFALIVITLDRFRATSASKDDPQVELKILLHALALMGLFVAADGVAGLVSSIAGGFHGGGDAIKVVLPSIVVGAGVVAGVAFLFLPRTNAATVRTAEALALFTVGVYFGVTAIANAYVFVTSVVMSGPWSTSSDALAHLVVDGAIGVLGLSRLGALSGWTIPVRPVAPPPPPQYPPQGGGYPPGGGGGYPPPGGGYPPQGGGGYPPQGGGGYPPPGGGYPPQGGGGYPPQGGGGGGYSPR
jgi:hypothetical protein